MSSTGVVAIFIPVVLLVAERQKLAPGRLMMPLSFAGLIGGMLTLVGTPPNLVADSALEHAGFAGFGFFDFTPFGARHPRRGHRLHAHRAPLAEPRGGARNHPVRTRRRLMDFVRDYELTGREHRIRVREDSRVVGQTLQQLEARQAQRSECRRHRALDRAAPRVDRAERPT